MGLSYLHLSVCAWVCVRGPVQEGTSGLLVVSCMAHAARLNRGKVPVLVGQPLKELAAQRQCGSKFNRGLDSKPQAIGVYHIKDPREGSVAAGTPSPPDPYHGRTTDSPLSTEGPPSRVHLLRKPETQIRMIKHTGGLSKTQGFFSLRLQRESQIMGPKGVDMRPFLFRRGAYMVWGRWSST